MASKIEQVTGKFIWALSGKILRVAFEEMVLPLIKGGLGLKCIRKMSNCLLLTQALRLLKSVN